MSATQTPPKEPQTLEEKAASFFTEQPRDESGKFSPEPAAPVPEAPPAPETSAPPADAPAPAAPPVETPPAPTGKKLKIKVDHEEQEIDLDAEYADEQRRAALAEKLRKGTAFDAVTARERQRGQQEALEFFQQQGYSVTQDPTTGQYKVVPPQPQVPTPAAKADVPPPDIDDLERRASEGDAAALVELNRIARTEASQARDAIRQRQEQEARAAAERQQAEALRQYAAHCGNAIDKQLAGLNLGTDAHAVAMSNFIRKAAASRIMAGAPLEEALAEIEAGARPFVEARKQTLAAVQPPKSSAPPPVIPSASGAASASGSKKEPKTLEELAAQFFPK